MTEELPKDPSLEQAKQWLRARFDDGARCPCCDQFVKLYRRPLNASMAYVLVLIYYKTKVIAPGEWIHVPSLIAATSHLNPRLAAAVRGDWAKLRFFGLLEEQPGERDDGSKRAGYYRITETGQRFVRGEVSVPAYVHLYNERLVERPVTRKIYVQQAFGKKFNYRELMEGTP